ncbi:MAG: WD40/YVTN/BNR-like repeat-containing protein [Phycisphaerae bacterium]
MTATNDEKSTLYIAGERTLWRIAHAGEEPEEIFSGEGLRAVSAGAGIVAVGLEERKVVVLGDDGRAAEATVDEPVESLLVISHRPVNVLVGTEDARLYRLTGEGLRRNANFDALDCRQTWHTPWGGPPAVRSMAATPDGWIYADIHVGSIMRSPDRGEHFEPVKPELHEDVHQVATCPVDANRIYANTAKAVYVSYDRGGSWEHRSAELEDRYGRAIAVAPEDPDLLLTTVSDGPHGDNVHGQLWRSDDCGRSWSHVLDGFPHSTRENINTHHVAFAADSTAWAVVGDTVYIGSQRACQWRRWRRMNEPIVMLASPEAVIEQA